MNRQAERDRRRQEKLKEQERIKEIKKEIFDRAIHCPTHIQMQGILRERLCLAMEKKGVNQFVLSKAAGVDTSQLGEWMRGLKVPNIYNVAKISLALDVSINWLLGVARSDRK